VKSISLENHPEENHPEPSKISRRQFLKQLGLVAGAVGLAACTHPPMPSSTPTLPPTGSPTATLTAAPSATPTHTPTAAPSPTATLAPLEAQIRQQGVATRIPVLEYHSLNSDVNADGLLLMNPVWFEEQMHWLKDNQFHAVTEQELIDFLTGSIQLPKRSVVLTFDVGSKVSKQMPEFVRIFEQTGMHGLFFIWLARMDAGLWDGCKSNADGCWSDYHILIESGYGEIGSHSMSHADMAVADYDAVVWELRESKARIEQHLPIEVRSFSWPFEAIPTKARQMFIETGYTLGFGGFSRYITELQAYPYPDFSLPVYDIPRLLPYYNNQSYPYLSGRTMGQETYADLLFRNITP